MDKKIVLKKLADIANLLVIVENIKSSFDVVVERKRQKYFVKILNNIDSINKEEAKSLKKISYFFESTPFIIGNFSNNGELEDYVLFKRFSIFAGTVNTFVSYINGECLAKKNSYHYYKIDGDKIRKLRQERGLSLQELSNKIGLSKETLYRYEKGQIMAGKENLELLEEFFNTKLSLPIFKEEKNFRLTIIGSFKGTKTKNPFNYLLKSKNDKVMVGKEKSNIVILKKYEVTYRKISEELNAEYFFITSKRIPFPYVLESEIRKYGFSKKIRELARKRAI